MYLYSYTIILFLRSLHRYVVVNFVAKSIAAMLQFNSRTYT